MINSAHLEVGAKIAYKLKPQDLPSNPLKIWIGKVLTYDPVAGLLWVESLEDGYTGLKEFVYFSQVVGVEKPE